jgi:MscS family membrane protein
MSLGSYLPPWLWAVGPGGLAYWQWLALPVVVVVAWLSGLLLERLSRVVLHLVTGRDDHPIGTLAAGPLRWLWALASAYFMLDPLGLPPRADHVETVILRIGTFVAFFWILLRLVSLAGERVQASPWTTTHPGLRSLVPLGVRIGRIAVAAIAIIAVLAELGYAVTSLLAGLGIGGLAVALAGQKTVENLFGAFAIGVDQPFVIGDTVRVDGIEGVVEAIGLRSTRIRTADRSVISLPNGKLAEMRIESLSARDRLRMSCVLTLAHGTSAKQLRGLLIAIEAVLRASPKTRQEDVVVALRELREHGLEVEVMTSFATIDWAELRSLREQALMGILDAVEQAGVTLAFPTRTVHLEQAREKQPVADSRRSFP